ncbi:hypothetical protein ACFL6T_07320 [Candidatus Zixiibacteriota bacterium]
MKPALGSILLICFLSVSQTQCGLVDSSHDTSIPEIEFIVSGGFWGGTIEHLTLDRQGLATLKSGYPELILELTTIQHDSILAVLAGIRELKRKEYFPDQMVSDDINIEIQIGSKIFHASEWYIYEHRSESGIDIVYQAVQTLHDLSMYTYQEAAPWIGLIFSAYAIQPTYVRGDTIKVIYSLSNPTDEERSLLFPHQYKIRFQAEAYGGLGGYFHLYPDPELVQRDESAPCSITIQPGDSWHMVFSWSQPYVDHNGNNMILEPGVYSLGMNMANGNFDPQFSTVEVVNSSVPTSNPN